MSNELKNCWEIMNCQREKNGSKVSELGECVASKEGLGHSCWMIAGTLCGGEVQGTVAEKEHNCMQCEVYKKYNRITGTEGKKVPEQFPEEEKKYKSLLKNRRRKS